MTARPSRQTSRRSFHSSSVDTGVSMPKLVSRSSATAMSQSTSKGSRPCSLAISPTMRPSYCAILGGDDVLKMRLVAQLAMPRIGLLGRLGSCVELRYAPPGRRGWPSCTSVAGP